MASILLVTHPTKGSTDKFFTRIKDVVDKDSERATILPELDGARVKQCVVGPNHLAFLMQDGRVCRVAYHITTQSSHKQPSSEEDEVATPAATCANKTPSNTSEATRASSFDVGETLNNLSGQLGGQLGRWTSQRLNVATTGTTSSASSLAGRVTTSRGRGRIIRAARARMGAGWLNGRALIPASAVPEELIAQAQIVLQGKSREVIIRELQKTSLDVNLAVNNLLSREDDDTEEADGDESFIQEAFLPQEDLISIFEAGIPNEEPFVVQRDPLFAEDILLNPLYSPSSPNEARANRVSNADNSNSAERGGGDPSRLRDRWWGLIIKNEAKEQLAAKGLTQAKRTTSGGVGTVHRFGEIQWWRFKDESDDSIKFSQIASLHSELLAVTENGFLHQWRWFDPDSPVTEIGEHCHSRAHDMCIRQNDKIVKMEACNVRVSVLTDAGKIATWFDGTLSAVGHKLEQPLQMFTEFKGHSVVNLSVCDLYTCVRLSNSTLHWWGVFPFEQRKKILDKVKVKAKKSAISGSGLIKSGTQVCIRSCPLYYPGAIGFTTINGEPRVGELMEQAWTIVEKCRFKLIEGKERKEKKIEKENEDEPTQSKRAKLDVEVNQPPPSPVYPKEEQWSLKDVIFVEEVRNVPVGTVLKVDGAYALVDFSSKKEERNITSVLDQCRLVRKDELQIVKWTTAPKMPECFQHTPKQLIQAFNTKVISMTADTKGVHALLKTANGLRYSTFSLATGRCEAGGQLSSASFLSKSLPNPSLLYSTGLETLTLLRDPNKCLYPLVKDNSNGIRTPDPLNLPPLSCLAVTRKSLNAGESARNDVFVALMVVQESELTHSILKCDAEVIHQFLSNRGTEELAKQLMTKVDGNRNIIHLSVSTCKPTKPNSKKEIANAEGGKTDIFDNSMWTPLFDGNSCLDILLTHLAISPHLFYLLSEKDGTGCTPFMVAVRMRAYLAALSIYNAAVDIARADTGVMNKERFMQMICPPTTDPDVTPLQVLCCNDTCSFTWTGTKHINQDIFECKTCGLVGSLCCCTECAQTCHVGHECKLKKTSPTAYCDCWQRCDCKALLPGELVARTQLLHKLVDETDLYTLPNKRGEHLLLFLVQTVARQNVEQLQFTQQRRDQPKSSIPRKGDNADCSPPDHNLEPPKFARTSLLYLLKNWSAVKSMIFFGCSKHGLKRTRCLDEQVVVSSMLQEEEIADSLDGQQGTAFLDNFVHKLIKCFTEGVDTILETLEKQLSEKPTDEETLLVVNRFIRAVIRVYVLLSVPTDPLQIKRKGISGLISNCKRVFSSLRQHAALQLAQQAAAIFAPVRMGIVYPSQSFALSAGVESESLCEELLSTRPMPSRLDTSKVRFADQQDTTEQQSITAPAENRTDDETDSDSDDSNHEEGSGETSQPNENSTSNQQPSSRETGRREESYFSTAEVSETEGEDEDDGEQQDDEEMKSEEEEDDEEEEDEDGGHLLDHLERTTSQTMSTTTESTSTAPRVLRWAVRDGAITNTTPSSTRPNTSGLYFVDRRTNTTASTNEVTSTTTTASTNTSHFSSTTALARTFAILIRDVGVLVSEDMQLRTSVDGSLKDTWKWLFSTMEHTESQLRFGASLTAVSEPSHPTHPLHERPTSSTRVLNVWSENRKKKKATGSRSPADNSSGRVDFLTYMLSLMRSYSNEHADALPKVEMKSLQHLAYAFDAFIYYQRGAREEPPPVLKSKKDEEEEEEGEISETEDEKPHKFFQRSNSTLVLGYDAADPFAPLKEALPLADRPHLLNPTGRREQLFGVKKNTHKTNGRAFLALSTEPGEEILGMEANVFLSRWHLCLELFGRLFLQTVGAEEHSILNELGRYEVKETKFKRDMEKLRNGHQKDLYLESLERGNGKLIQQTLRQLNSQFGRRLPGAAPLNVHKVKVSFLDEQGEGNGVARSFYTAITQAFLADEDLPDLSNIFSGSRGLSQQLRARVRDREMRRMSPSSGSRRERYNERTANDILAASLSLRAETYAPDSTDSSSQDDTPLQRKDLGRRLYNRVQDIDSANAGKVTGMLLELTPTQIIYLLTNSSDVLEQKVREAQELINSATKPATSLVAYTDHEDNSPLFFQPGKSGYYSPRPGKNSVERINCFRNVGRVIGLCLQQNEICPLVLNRHVIKYLLCRKIGWHDVAFFDPVLYESFRQLILDAQREDNTFGDLHLNFTLQLKPEEGGGCVELVKGGSQVEVSSDNVHDYIKRYAEYRMLTFARRPLQAMRRGVLDVIQANHLEGLTAEDFRLLLNGTGDINIPQLMSLTFFSDETAGEGQEKITKFKKWFWSLVENMTSKQKQDLLYFWTSSPAMPASAEGFQPLPSVTLKPANDHQLPTANTCISRLYVPLYSSKQILRSKFLLAIKTKVFGFV